MAAVDPGAIYNTTLADLGLQSGNELAKIGEEEGFTRTNVGNKENTLTQQEPATYTAESNRANKGGILTSGINTQRKGTIAANFAGKRTANQAELSQRLSSYNKGRETVGLKQKIKEHEAAATKAVNEDDAYRAANPIVPPEPKPYAPPGTPQIPAGATPPPGMEFVNGLTVPIGTKTVKAKARR